MKRDLLTIQIDDDQSLLRACDFLHDSLMDVASIKYDQADGTWTSTFEREYLEDPQQIRCVRRFGIFYKYTFPVTHCEFTLKGIRDCRIKGNPGKGLLTFIACEIKDSTYELSFCESMVILFRFEERPIGILKDHYFLEKEKTISSLGRYFNGVPC